MKKTTTDSEQSAANPFRMRKMGKYEVSAISAEDRVEMVRRFSVQECENALELQEPLQKTVRNALRSRLRVLGKEV